MHFTHRLSAQIRIPRVSSCSLLFWCGRLYCNGVKFALPFFCDSSSTVVILLHEAHLFQLLQDVASNLPRSFCKDIFTGSTAQLSAINFPHRANSHTSADVDLSNHRRSTNVKPIWVIRWQLLELSCLDNIGPLGNFEPS